MAANAAGAKGAKRLFEGKDSTKEYTKAEFNYAYQVL